MGDAGPAGGTGTTRTTFGPQPLSTKHSAGAFGFGASSREVAGKLFISQEHTALATAGRHSPGPAVYLLPPSVGGKQPDGRRRDPPSWGFGTSSRFKTASQPKVPAPGYYAMPAASVGPQTNGRFRTEPQMGFGTAERKHVRKVWISQAHQKTDQHGMDSPGPFAPYELGSTCGGKQVESMTKTMPSWVFSSAARAKDGTGGDGAANNCTLPASVGVQPDSRKPAAPMPGFGASTRDQRAMIYIGPDHDKGSHGMLSPGPAAPYEIVASVGKQVASRYGSAPQAPFSKEDRWHSYTKELKANTTPGPGAY